MMQKHQYKAKLLLKIIIFNKTSMSYREYEMGLLKKAIYTENPI
jgi:hypothetical protein